MGMMNSFKVYKAVVNGEEMKVHLNSVTERPNPNFGKEGEKSKDLQGYIDFEWIREDGRPLRDSRSFPQGVNILVEQLLAQHEDLPTSIGLDELTDKLINDKTEFSCWAYSNYVDGVEYRNYGFKKPEPKSEQQRVPQYMQAKTTVKQAVAVVEESNLPFE